MTERLTRIAIVSSDRCKPKKCRQECKKSCPVVKTGLVPSIPFLFLIHLIWILDICSLKSKILIAYFNIILIFVYLMFFGQSYT